MKKITLFTFIAVLAMAFVGCSSTNTANNSTVKVNGTTVNSNTAVVVNSNTMPVTNTNASSSTGNSNNWNSNITREEYDKNKEDFANRAKSTGSTIGSGVNDGWLWTKTKAALATTNELRDSTINVDVDNAVVTLKGSVATKAEADKAISVAKGIEGVKDVKSVLAVKPNDSLTNQMTGGSSGNRSNTNANKK